MLGRRLNTRPHGESRGVRHLDKMNRLSHHEGYFYPTKKWINSFRSRFVAYLYLEIPNWFSLPVEFNHRHLYLSTLAMPQSGSSKWLKPMTIY